jgi:hypothetical protein
VSDFSLMPYGHWSAIRLNTERNLMPTITLRRKDGSEIETVKSHLLVCHAGSVTHTLHLHRDSLGFWAVSDPRSGGKVLHVQGQYKGVPCSSNGMLLRDIRGLAQQQIDALIERVGSDRFNTILTPSI